MIETVWNDCVVLADENDTDFFSVYDSEGNEVEDLSYGEVCEICGLLLKSKKAIHTRIKNTLEMANDEL